MFLNLELKINYKRKHRKKENQKYFKKNFNLFGFSGSVAFKISFSILAPTFWSFK